MSISRLGFRVQALYKLKKPSVLRIARQKLSFIIASLSLFAFVVGNMVGQHGWYVFWKSVLGKEDDAAIAFVGTVPPIDKVPDFARWAQYGGDPKLHTYRLVPQNVLIPLPAYDPKELQAAAGNTPARSVYSIGNLGNYITGEDRGGSHVGIDIRVPVGTPVVSIANGIVEKVSLQETGYGHHIVIRHPNVPDPDQPEKTTTVYSIYAHLDAVLVAEGQVVYKGEQIATSGKTGFVSGSHLHFQIDKSSAPFHPYWPFTSDEARLANLSFTEAINAGLHQERGDLYTLSPMLFVQQYERYTPIIVRSAVVSKLPSPVIVTQSPGERQRVLRAERLKVRLMRFSLRQATSPVPVANAPAARTPETGQVSEVKTAAAGETVSVPIIAGSDTDVSRLAIEHSGKLTHTWQRVKITALDQDGNTVLSPSFKGRLFVIPEFGEAEIRPKELSSLDFVNGIAIVNVLARGSKTLFIATRGAFVTVSAPMVFER